MRQFSTLVAAGLYLACLVGLASMHSEAAEPVPDAVLDKPRVLVLTDISNEPDDEESVVRFLVYSNEYDVDGIVATTSTLALARLQFFVGPTGRRG